MKLNVESSDWFVKPEMLGHTWASQTVALVKELVKKYGKTKLQKEILDFCFSLDNTDWHYWANNISKKYIGQVRYVLRRAGKTSWTGLLYHLNATSGLLKDNLTWYLELQAYRFEFNEYWQSYKVGFRLLGLSERDCLQRYVEYHNRLAVKHGIDI
jgi:hypothetical protein